MKKLLIFLFFIAMLLPQEAVKAQSVCQDGNGWVLLPLGNSSMPRSNITFPLETGDERVIYAVCINGQIYTSNNSGVFVIEGLGSGKVVITAGETAIDTMSITFQPVATATPTATATTVATATPTATATTVATAMPIATTTTVATAMPIATTTTVATTPMSEPNPIIFVVFAILAIIIIAVVARKKH